MPSSRALVGTAGWSYPDWKGVVYPEHPPRGFDALRYLARFVDVVEINHSFYRPPTRELTLGWLAFEITGSQAQLGVIYLCGFVPQFALTLLGGVLADRITTKVGDEGERAIDLQLVIAAP